MQSVNPGVTFVCSGSPCFPAVTDESEPSAPSTSPAPIAAAYALLNLLPPKPPSMAECTSLPGTELKSPAVTTGTEPIGEFDARNSSTSPRSLRACASFTSACAGSQYRCVDATMTYPSVAVFDLSNARTPTQSRMYLFTPPSASTGASVGSGLPSGWTYPTGRPHAMSLYSMSRLASSSNLSRLKNNPQPSRLDLVSCVRHLYTPSYPRSASHGCQNSSYWSTSCSARTSESRPASSLTRLRLRAFHLRHAEGLCGK
mmetsp:Transcript_956/g.3602  ORF Transcript_956/g.3602 Transcript_956/m.3602 type:complete len:258 (+) Transcript_956:133-906(+)